MKLDTGAQVCYGVNDMSSDGMQEEEFFLFIIIGFSLPHNTRRLDSVRINSDGLESYANGCVQ